MLGPRRGGLDGVPTGLGPWAHLSLPPLPPALRLLRQEGPFPEQCQRLSLGCPVLDVLLRGGLPLDGITELAGHSSAGKTQLALQLCLAVQLPRCHGGLGAGECQGWGSRPAGPRGPFPTFPISSRSEGPPAG